MKTSKPISTISYNSDVFLRRKIYEWRNKGIIDYGMWILHQPDTDGDKAHYHVYLQPAKRIQTDDLITDSIEIDPTWKPLDYYSNDRERTLHEQKQFFKMTVFKSSETSNWILYGLHDEKYLADKGLTRNIHYDPKDIESTCEDTFYEMLSCAYDNLNGKFEQRLLNAINDGKSWQEIVRSGMIPVHKITGARLFYMAITGQEKGLF